MGRLRYTASRLYGCIVLIYQRCRMRHACISEAVARIQHLEKKAQKDHTKYDLESDEEECPIVNPHMDQRQTVTTFSL
jgi:hypothetical protein